jgi:hypothetical protein
MMVASKRERFPLPRASGCCRFGQRTFAGASGNDKDAPISAVRVNAMGPLESTLIRRSVAVAGINRSSSLCGRLA